MTARKWKRKEYKYLAGHVSRFGLDCRFVIQKVPGITDVPEKPFQKLKLRLCLAGWNRVAYAANTLLITL
jgi:hypothetical protein